METGKGKGMVLITGATGGLGKAFAVECANRGWDLFLTDQQESALSILASSLRRSHEIRVLHRACDFTDADSRTALLQDLRDQELRFWMLINVAGTDFEGDFLSCSRKQIRTILRVNVEGNLDLTHGVIRLRESMMPFRVINVASLAAFYPMPTKAAYAASKRFLLDFSRALREELRPIGGSVTALCPGGLYTNPECIEAIDAQGLAGHLTAENIGSVAAETVDRAMRGDAIYVPGAFNQALRLLGSFLPPSAIASFIYARWQGVREKRQTAEMI